MTQRPDYTKANTFYQNPVKMSTRPDKTELWACINDIAEGQMLAPVSHGEKAVYVKRIIDVWPAKGQWHSEPPFVYHVEVTH